VNLRTTDNEPPNRSCQGANHCRCLVIGPILKEDIFIQAISIAPRLVHYYSEALPTHHGYILCRSFTPKRHRQQ